MPAHIPFSPPLKGCSFCDCLKGITLVPFRYAVVGSNYTKEGRAKILAMHQRDSRVEDDDFYAGAPALDDRYFRIENVRNPELGGGAQYTLRALRQGYLYLYYEHTQKWVRYVVLRGGALWRLPSDGVWPSRIPDSFNCHVPLHRIYANMITIPEKATRVWMAFSHTQWTDWQFKAYGKGAESTDVMCQDPETIRKAHMRLIDVTQWKSTQAHPHIAPLKEVGQHVNDFKQNNTKLLEKAYEYTSAPFDINMRQLHGSYVADAFDAAGQFLNPEQHALAMMVALDDPLALMEDLSLLTSPDAYYESIENPLWGTSSDAFLKTLEASVGYNALLDAVNNRITKPAGIEGAALYAEETAVKLSDPVAQNYLANLTVSEQQEIMDKAWAKYEEKIDTNKRTAYTNNAKAMAQAFNEQQISPVAQSLVNWFNSDQLYGVMRYHHDNQDALHGILYDRAFAKTFRAAVDCAEIQQLMTRWIERFDPCNNREYYARAAIHNCQKAAQELAKLNPTQTGLSVITDPLVTFSITALLTLRREQAIASLRNIMFVDPDFQKLPLPILLAKLGHSAITVSQSQIIVTRVLGKSISRKKLNSVVLKKFCAVLSWITGTEVYIGKINVPYLTDFILAYIKKTFKIKVIQPYLKNDIMERFSSPAAKGLLKNYNKDGYNTNDIVMLMFDMGPVDKYIEDKGICEAAENVNGIFDIERLTKLDHSIGVMLAIFAGIGFVSALEELQNRANLDPKAIKELKLASASAVVLSALFDIGQKGITSVVSKGEVLAHGIAKDWRAFIGAQERVEELTPKAEQWVIKTGRVMGGISAAIMAGVDVYNTYEAYEAGNRLLTLSYAVSAADGLYIAWVLAFSTEPVGVVAFAIYFAAQGAIYIFSDSDTMKWVKQCYFSKTLPHYPDLHIEIEAYAGLEIQEIDMKGLPTLSPKGV